MHRSPLRAGAAVLIGLAVLCIALPSRPIATLGAAQEVHQRLLVTVTDAAGTPVSGLTAEDFTVRVEGDPLEIVSVDPAPPAVQVVAVFEGLAVTQRQLSSALSVFIGSLDDDSIVDMQSVEGELDAAIIEAIDDLHARAAARPVILMLGQASEIAPSNLQSSQVRGRRRAADLSGRLEQLAEFLAMHGIQFYGVSVTDVPLTNFARLAAGSGGRFQVVAASDEFSDALARIGRELRLQYLVSIRAADAGGGVPRVTVARPGVTVRATAYAPMH